VYGNACCTRRKHVGDPQTVGIVAVKSPSNAGKGVPCLFEQRGYAVGRGAPAADPLKIFGGPPSSKL